MSVQVKVKLCGIRRVDDALAAADAGADFIGLIFVPSSQRFVTRDEARAIVRGVRARGRIGPQVVGVFRDASVAEMEEMAEDAELDLLQLHGNESAATVEELSLPTIKAFRIDDRLPPTTSFDHATWHLFDTFDPTAHGGTGQPFPWSLLSTYRRERPFFLAGGINPSNVAEAIAQVKPDAIDVSSGIEESPGVKSREKIEQLFRNLRSLT